MNIVDLRMFESVARLGAMNRAAKSMNTVQSNVTTRIKALEHEIGAPLFERHGRGVSLTAAGRRLLPYSRKILHLVAGAARVAVDDGMPTGRVTLGALETTAALRLSPILSRYVAAYPDVDLTLTTGTTADLIGLVLSRDIEGAFVCGPIEHADLESEEMFREELVVLAAPGVKSLRGVLRNPDIRIVVLKAGCSYRQRLEQIMAKRGVASPRMLEFGTLEAIFRCVGAGLGITLLPVSLVGAVWKEGLVRVHRLPDAEGRVDTVFIRRRDSRASSALNAFLGLSRSQFGQRRK